MAPQQTPRPRHHPLVVALVPALLYVVLASVLSYPLITTLADGIIGQGNDSYHNLWSLWHVQQAAHGAQPLYHAPTLYYPVGITMLTHAPGPWAGLLALPFWGWGAPVAHNLTALLLFATTGYCTFLLARGNGLSLSAALFAGALLMLAPMCVAGFAGHITKLFYGGIALVLLGYTQTIRPARSNWWLLLPAAAFLILMMHQAYQVVYAALCVVVFVAVALVVPPAGTSRWWVLRRSVLAGILVLLVCSPLLVAIFMAANDPRMWIGGENEAWYYAVDALQLLLPGAFQWQFPLVAPLYAQYDMRATIETTVHLALTGLVLVAFAMRLAWRVALPWLVAFVVMVVLALGPELIIAGNHTGIALPYALLMSLPGLDFMRVPGRAMMGGFVCFAVLAAIGLHAAMHRWHRWRWAWLGGALLLLTLEYYPTTFALQALPPVPAFYHERATDDEMYGIFDFPLKSDADPRYYVAESAQYQWFQMTHHKGIASGYVSRTYREHPLFDYMIDYYVPFTFTVNGRSELGVRFYGDLLANNYRYVTYHTTLGRDPKRTASLPAVLHEIFADQPPLTTTPTYQVYAVEAARYAQHPHGLHLREGDGWHAPEAQWRWAQSPATLTIETDRPRRVTLTLDAVHMYSGTQRDLTTTGTLTVTAPDGTRTSHTLTADSPTAIPLLLRAGTQTVRLSLTAGNFSPGDGDDRLLSFAVRQVDITPGNGQ